ncbi:MAG: DUF1697 domain-containing protein [Rhizobacter sp.]|nr:DUF1697 domain-containing protein [Rhizobacter sp.]
MPHFAVLLRGVNVGRGNRLPMADFRQLLESLGGSQVRTLLNSGNAVYASSARSAERQAEAIHDALLEEVGIDVRVIVKSASQLDAVVRGIGWAGGVDDPSRLLVAFAQHESVLKGLSALSPLIRPEERFELGAHAAYLWCGGGILESQAGAALLGKIGREVTTRNWATVLKLQALMKGVAGA